MTTPTDVSPVDIIHGEFKLKPMRLRLDGSNWVNTQELYVENRHPNHMRRAALGYIIIGHVRMVRGEWVIYDQPGYAQPRKLSDNDQAKLTAWMLAQ